MKRFLLLLSVIFLTAPSFVVAASVPGDNLKIPRGFELVDHDRGVALFRKRRDYVHVVSPRQGAAVRILHGKRVDEGLYGSFQRRDIQEWWREWSAGNDKAFSVVNGQFFDQGQPDFTSLAFSMKVDGKVYEGYADATEFQGKKMMLLLRPERHLILPYDDDPMTLVRLPHENVLVGLNTVASKSYARPIPRTFMGTTRDGRTVIFSSSMASQSYANRLLRMFGAREDQIMMLDGGSSAHLIHDGKVLVPSDAKGKKLYARERLPQILGIEAGLRK